MDLSSRRTVRQLILSRVDVLRSKQDAMDDRLGLLDTTVPDEHRLEALEGVIARMRRQGVCEELLAVVMVECCAWLEQFEDRACMTHNLAEKRARRAA